MKDSWIFKDFSKIQMDDWIPLCMDFSFGRNYSEEDKDLMEKELLVIKGVCDLYLHGTIESSTKEVHDAFKCALNESLNIQNNVLISFLKPVNKEGQFEGYLTI